LRKILPFLLLLSCFPQREPLNVDLFVVKDGGGFRVVGFIPADYIREEAYIPTLLFPKRMILEVGGRKINIYADVLALTLDKQRKFKRAFLVSDTYSYFGERVGEIFGKLIFTEPRFEVEKKEIAKFGNLWYVYVFVKFIPAARSYPKLLALKNGEADTFFPVEISKFLTKYPPRDDFKYRSWYDEWIFLGEIFGDSL
jgi:hypothetical protein